MSTKNPDGTTTYENEMSVPKFNLMALDVDQIVSELEYLLYVEHEEDMKSYLHLKPMLEEIAKLTVRISDRAVAEFQQDMTLRIAKHLQETIGDQIGNVIYDAQKVGTRRKVIVKTTIDDEKVVSQTVEPHNDW